MIDARYVQFVKSNSNSNLKFKIPNRIKLNSVMVAKQVVYFHQQFKYNTLPNDIILWKKWSYIANISQIPINSTRMSSPLLLAIKRTKYMPSLQSVHSKKSSIDYKWRASFPQSDQTIEPFFEDSIFVHVILLSVLHCQKCRPVEE